MWTSHVMDSMAPFRRRNLDRQHCSEENNKQVIQPLCPVLAFSRLSLSIDFCSHVSIGSQHVSHVSCVGELPPVDVLYDNDGLVRCSGWFHHIRVGVLYLDLLAEPSILHPITDITGARLGFICHLVTEGEGIRGCITENIVSLMCLDLEVTGSHLNQLCHHGRPHPCEPHMNNIGGLCVVVFKLEEAFSRSVFVSKGGMQQTCLWH